MTLKIKEKVSKMTALERKIQKRVLHKLATLMAAGFGLVAALAWNEAIKGLFAEDGALHFMSIGGPWGYAVIVTIVAVIVTIWMSKLAESID